MCSGVGTGHDIATTFPYVYTSEGCSPRLLRSTATARVFRGAKIELRGLEVKKNHFYKYSPYHTGALIEQISEITFWVSFD